MLFNESFASYRLFVLTNLDYFQIALSFLFVFGFFKKAIFVFVWSLRLCILP